MVTEVDKGQRLLKVFNIGMYGMIKGLWDLFGETSFATANSIGAMMLATVEKESGLEVKGDSPEAILHEVVHLLVDEVGTMSAGTVEMADGTVSIACKDCFLRDATGWLEAEGVQPFACLPMGLSAAAMRKHLGVKHRLQGRALDPATQTCTIKFQLVE